MRRTLQMSFNVSYTASYQMDFPQKSDSPSMRIRSESVCIIPYYKLRGGQEQHQQGYSSRSVCLSVCPREF